MLFSLVWATLTSWLYKRAKTQMKMDVKEYVQFLTEVEQEVFKRFYPRSGVTNAWERVGRVSKIKRKAREAIPENTLLKISYKAHFVKSLGDIMISSEDNFQLASKNTEDEFIGRC